MKCQFPGCNNGVVAVVYSVSMYVTRDMALDAGDPQLEGMKITGDEFDYDLCPCCGGESDSCAKCRDVQLGLSDVCPYCGEVQEVDYEVCTACGGERWTSSTN